VDHPADDRVRRGKHVRADAEREVTPPLREDPTAGAFVRLEHERRQFAELQRRREAGNAGADNHDVPLFGHARVHCTARLVRMYSRRMSTLLERLDAGALICAEGYLFEIERRGYLQAGPYVPEVVLEHPEVVEQLHRDFVHAGSDVVEAFTYYAHREKLRLIDKAELVEAMNRNALAIAKSVAQETDTMLAGDICNTNVFVPGDPQTREAALAMFEEQIGWAAEAGVDFVIAETFAFGEEALLALECVRRADLPAVVTLAIFAEGATLEGWPPEEACKRLEQAGATVVGLNCLRGPWTMLPLLRRVRGAVACHVAALPVPYRTTAEEPTFFNLTDLLHPGPEQERPFPVNLDPFLCSRREIGDFAREAFDLGIHYLGLCCGAGPHTVRALAEALGRVPPASRYSADMSKHAYLGTDQAIPQTYKGLGKRVVREDVPAQRSARRSP
jgi:betaine-homocysteine S-methyltransferase